MECITVEIGVDGHGGDPEFTTCSDDPNCDFSTICDEYF
jgi:hypothetical protein